MLLFLCCLFCPLLCCLMPFLAEAAGSTQHLFVPTKNVTDSHWTSKRFIFMEKNYQINTMLLILQFEIKMKILKICVKIVFKCISEEPWTFLILLKLIKK